MGYHLKHIEKGELGDVSKITEEYEEFIDAIEQGNIIMALLELSDLLGAIEWWADRFSISIEDIINMTKATERAFKDGSR